MVFNFVFMDSDFVCVCIFLVIFKKKFLVYLFLFACLFSKKREREIRHGVGWTGRWGLSGRRWGHD